MSVEGLVKRLRKKRERVHDLSGVGYIDDPDCQEAADKLEELAAENERLRKDCYSYEKTMQAIAALEAEDKTAHAEKDKEIDWQRLCDVINAANRVSARTGKEHVTDANELREFALARNAGGNDEPCRGCGDGDKVPASGYWRCPVCDAEWSGEDAE